MKQITVPTVLVMIAMAGSSAFAEDSGSLEAALRQVVEKNLAAYNSENPSETLASVHTQSPAYPAMREALPAQFEELDARSSLERFSYMGHDEEFAVARVQYRTVEGSAEPFAGNIVDTITVFHQEGGTWKYWDDHVLGVRLVQE